MTLTATYDREPIIHRALSAPRWVHFGAGNIFRAFIALGADRAIEAGAMDTGLIACASRDEVEYAYRPVGDLCASVVLGADGTMDVRIVGSVAASLVPTEATDFQRLEAMFRSPTLQLASFTITEKGYAPGGLMDIIGQLMLARYRAGGHPVALVSMDNCSKNGAVLKAAVLRAAEGVADAGFSAYVSDPAKVSFPWTMIDKITPQPDPAIAEKLRELGLQGMEVHTTERGAKIAPFVNAEQPGYLVIEDDFPGGRPDFAACGFLMADRDTVEKAERMKVTACLNPLHTALAVFGCLLGYERISQEMKDEDLVALVRHLGYQEGLPVVENPGILDPKAFLNTVLTERFPNPFMPDSPQRIAMDTSQKLAIRFGETIKAHVERGDAGELVAIPLAIAGWLRYLTGVDDEGHPFERSPDPMLAELQPLADHLRERGSAFEESALEPLLRDQKVFGVDLVAAGVAEKVLENLRAMLQGPGAVRRAIAGMSL